MEPLPCPLCGQPAWVQKFPVNTTVQCSSATNWGEGHSVYTFHPDPDIAIAMWNKRHVSENISNPE